jgi:hypothetical protein
MSASQSEVNQKNNLVGAPVGRGRSDKAEELGGRRIWKFSLLGNFTKYFWHGCVVAKRPTNVRARFGEETVTLTFTVSGFESNRNRVGPQCGR